METTSHEPRAACVRNRARESAPRKHWSAWGTSRHNSDVSFPSSIPTLAPPPPFFIDVSSGRVHLLIRTSSSKRHGYATVSLPRAAAQTRKLQGPWHWDFHWDAAGEDKEGVAGEDRRGSTTRGELERERRDYGHSVGSKRWRRRRDRGEEDRWRKEKSLGDDEGDVLYRSHLEHPPFAARGRSCVAFLFIAFFSCLLFLLFLSFLLFFSYSTGLSPFFSFSECATRVDGDCARCWALLARLVPSSLWYTVARDRSQI